MAVVPMPPAACLGKDRDFAIRNICFFMALPLFLVQVALGGEGERELVFSGDSVSSSQSVQSLSLCDPTDCSTPGLPVHHQLPELAQTHVPPVGDAINLSVSLGS